MLIFLQKQAKQCKIDFYIISGLKRMRASLKIQNVLKDALY